jgi:hypothetical protein
MSMLWTAVALSPAELSLVRASADPFSALRALPSERQGGADKAWAAAHWLLTGGAEPVDGPDGFLLSGGLECDELDAGYGPARYLDAAALRESAAVLARLTRDRLEARWDSDAMAEDLLYPFFENLGDHDAPFVLGQVDELRDFLARQAAAGLGALVFLA